LVIPGDTPDPAKGRRREVPGKKAGQVELTLARQTHFGDRGAVNAKTCFRDLPGPKGKSADVRLRNEGPGTELPDGRTCIKARGAIGMLTTGMVGSKRKANERQKKTLLAE